MINEKTENVKQNERDYLKEFEEHKNFADKIQKTLASFYKRPVKGSKIYEEEYSTTGISLLNCGNYLSFRKFHDEQHTTKLNSANFCKHKLCPFCAWRWHLKNSAILSKAFELLGSQEYFHLVLTIPNVKFLNKEFILGLREKATKFVKKFLNIQDYFLSFEITIDEQGNFHPHYHIILIKSKDEFPTKKALQSKWAYFANTGTNFAICDLKKCNNSKISLELTKYILKFNGADIREDKLFIVNNALKGIRKFSSSGIIKKAIDEAKKEIDKAKFDEMQKLKKYDSDIEFFEWLGSNYRLKEILKKPAEEE